MMPHPELVELAALVVKYRLSATDDEVAANHLPDRDQLNVEVFAQELEALDNPQVDMLIKICRKALEQGKRHLPRDKFADALVGVILRIVSADGFEPAATIVI